MSLTWEDAEREGLVAGWEYVAHDHDGNVCCDACAPYHGQVFATIAELAEVMPLEGPNPVCERGGGCWCRCVPNWSA